MFRKAKERLMRRGYTMYFAMQYGEYRRMVQPIERRGRCGSFLGDLRSSSKWQDLQTLAIGVLKSQIAP